MSKKKIKVLIIDDSAVVRHVLQKGLEQCPQIEVVGTAKDPFDATEKIIAKRPDVLTLDIEMPKMTGVDFLRQLLPQYPILVVMVSFLIKCGGNIMMKSLELGAVDFVSKPKGDILGGIDKLMDELIEKIEVASTVDIEKLRKQRKLKPVKFEKQLEINTNLIIAFGVSTGGLDTMKFILSNLPHNMPGIVITQHMPAGYTKSYAQTLNDFSDLYIVEASDGDKITPGKVLIAPGGYHMAVYGKQNNYYVKCYEGDKVTGHRPSVDVLFNSMAKVAGKDGIGVILTGMGKDGAQGLGEMKNKGSFNIAQDEKSCVVFGMPRVAIENNSHTEILDLKNIPTKLVKLSIIK